MHMSHRQRGAGRGPGQGEGRRVHGHLSMGGTLVAIRNGERGEIPVQGFTEGGSGAQQTVMAETSLCDAALSGGWGGARTARFEAVLDPHEPILATI